MKTHKDLTVWQKSIDFVTLIYEITSKFPPEEKFGLSNQLRRASVSIPSNIAEGAARKGRTELRQFLHIALGSASEIETQLIIARNLNFINNELYSKLNNEIIEIRKMLNGLIKSIKINS